MFQNLQFSIFLEIYLFLNLIFKAKKMILISIYLTRATF